MSDSIKIIPFYYLYNISYNLNHIAIDLFPNEKVFLIIKHAILIDSSYVDPYLLSEIQKLL